LGLSGVSNFNITDIGAGSTITVSGWTGTGIVDSAPFVTLAAVKDADFTLTNSSLVTSDGMNLTLEGPTVALVGGPGNNHFDVSGFTGSGSVTGGGGGD